MATVTYAKASRIFPGSARPAVNALDLHIGDGEFLVLVGPSGCGKSTSLRMVAGLEEVDQGAIYIDDEDVTNVPPKARDIAMVFQTYALYPHMTAYQNMAFGLKIRKIAKAEIDRRVRAAARLLDLDEALLSRKPKALSGGQRQRVAMGRAIVREPQVFLMDEPLSNLDAKLRVQTRAQIAALQQRLGVTTIYVTHDQVEAMTLGDRVAVLHDGVLQQVDSPRRLYDQPANAFVGGFIGSPAMNLRTVSLTETGADFAGLIVPLTREQIAAARLDGGAGRVTIGFRPEHADLVGPGEGGIPVTVELVEELGSDAYVHAKVTGRAADPATALTDLHGGDSLDPFAVDLLAAEPLAAEPLVVRANGRATPRLGEAAYVRPRPGAQHVFHARTGERLP